MTSVEFGKFRPLSFLVWFTLHNPGLFMFFTVLAVGGHFLGLGIGLGALFTRGQILVNHLQVALVLVIPFVVAAMTRGIWLIP
jgi:hypothetical protein